MSDDRELIEVFGQHLPAIQQQLQRQTERTEDNHMESAPAAPAPADSQAHKKQKANGPQPGEPSGTLGPQQGRPSKGQGRSGQNRPQGNGKGWRHNDREGRETSSSTSRDDHRLLTQLALLSLRQEDELQLLRTEKQLFLNADQQQ